MMRLALRAALRGNPSPNPHVGAVIARGEQILSVGHHSKAGGFHAEVDAIEKAQGHTEHSTLYVTMEPCNHYGRTPPCTDAIVAAKIARVVIACEDPAPHLPGAIGKLRTAGIDVEIGLLRKSAQALIADFSKHIKTRTPFVTLKTAMTLDGKVATRSGESQWITGLAARRLGHRMRAYADAVLTGSGTALADNPSLTVRHVRGRNPLRVVVDSYARTPVTHHLVADAQRIATWLFHSEAAPEHSLEALRNAGVRTILSRTDSEFSSQIDLSFVLEVLGKNDVVRLLVEAGPTLSGSLLRRGLVDQIAAFIAPDLVGDQNALSVVAGIQTNHIQEAIKGKITHMYRVGRDALICVDMK